MENQVTSIPNAPILGPNPFGIDPARSYNQTEVSGLLQVSTGALERWRSNATHNPNLGPAFVKIGRAVFYLGSDLLEWIQSNRVASDTLIS